MEWIFQRSLEPEADAIGKMANHCRHSKCRAPVFLLKNNNTGKVSVIDMEPVAGGNVEVDIESGTYRVVPKVERELSPFKPRHKSHFATCIVADRFR